MPGRSPGSPRSRSSPKRTARGSSAGVCPATRPRACCHRLLTCPSRPGQPDRLLKDGERPLGARGPLRAIWTPGTRLATCASRTSRTMCSLPGTTCCADQPQHQPVGRHHRRYPRGLPRIARGARGCRGRRGPPRARVPVRGIPRRGSASYESHHDARLREVLAIVGGLDGCTTAEVAERLTWSRPWDQNLGMVRRSAIGETYAHLVHLERRGLLSNASGEVDRVRGPWRGHRDPGPIAPSPQDPRSLSET